MITYLFTGLKISTAISLVAGLAIGVSWGIAGITSAWLFFAEMFSMLAGGAVILIAQIILACIATASLGLKSGSVLCVSFVAADPAFLLITTSIAISIAFLLERLCRESRASRFNPR